MKFAALAGVLVITMASLSNPAPQRVSLQDLLTTPETFDGKFVSLSACAIKGFEQFGLRECESKASFLPLICLDDFEHTRTESKVLGPDYRGPAYDQPERNKEEERLYVRLMRMRINTRMRVDLQGEFQFSKEEKFGMGCSQRIIVHRVLKVSPE